MPPRWPPSSPPQRPRRGSVRSARRGVRRVTSPMHHLLVTNDFPPKRGGIQNYLWELWRRLPPDSFTVVTPDHPDAAAWDATQPFAIERVRAPVLVPGRSLVRRVNALAAERGASLVLLDPVAHLAPLVRWLEVPWGVVVHGAEVVVPAAVPVGQLLVRHALRGASIVVAAGNYPALAAEQAAGRPLPTVVIPPGIDAQRFAPLDPQGRLAARRRFGVAPDAPLVVSVSRLVPRKGMDHLITASATLAERFPTLSVLIAGEGRDLGRLERLVTSTGAPVRLVGPVADDDLPGFLGMADVFAMLCRNRWGGLEQEGFGIVFLEAASCGVPQVAGRSGGVADAVVHDLSGLIVDDPRDDDAVVGALDALLGDGPRRVRLGDAGRRRVVDEFDHDLLAAELAAALADTPSAPGGDDTHADPVS